MNWASNDESSLRDQTAALNYTKIRRPWERIMEHIASFEKAIQELTETRNRFTRYKAQKRLSYQKRMAVRYAINSIDAALDEAAWLIQCERENPTQEL